MRGSGPPAPANNRLAHHRSRINTNQRTLPLAPSSSSSSSSPPSSCSPPSSPTFASAAAAAASPATAVAPSAVAATAAATDARFSPLAIRIPTASLIDDDFMAGFSFTKRGSIMLGGGSAPRPPNLDGTLDQQQQQQQQRHQQKGDDADRHRPAAAPADADADAALSPPPARAARSTAPRPVSQVSTADTVARSLTGAPDIRVLSVDVEKESQKVRSLYETGDGINWEDGARHSFCERLEPTPEVPAEEAALDPAAAAQSASHFATPRSASFYSQPPDSAARRETELAGGLEDWEDVDGADVDRYGFISAPRPASRISTPTELRSAQLSPRRRNVLQKRDPMGFSSQLGGARVPSRKVSARSLNTQNSEVSVASVRSSRSVLRQAGNLLPHNRNRRWMDEAGDMLTVSRTR
ncbi:hypothetical protein CDD83_5361 [Cordyceps sp. RAO-2017]|nr:hypothetical protein CDD83_5361 [Cordyceps sp. RAO-2017]